MNNKYILINILICSLFLFSCKDDEAKMQITNKVHNIRLDKISFSGISIGTNILPGESTNKFLISEKYDNISFPLTSPVQFYMVSGDNKVFLQTKESFTLNAGDDLNIIINDETEVVNMMTTQIAASKIFSISDE